MEWTPKGAPTGVSLARSLWRSPVQTTAAFGYVPALSIAGELIPLFLPPPVEYAADAPARVERFLLLRVQAVIKGLKLWLDCL